MLPLTQFRVLNKENQSQGIVTTKEVQIARSHRAVMVFIEGQQNEKPSVQ